MRLRAAPPLIVSQWFNTDKPLSLEALRGKVVVIEAFQMLCPGCVSHALPQAQRVAAAFSTNDVAVIGLHTVFEHHEAMRPEALKAFLHEYRSASRSASTSPRRKAFRGRWPRTPCRERRR